MNFGWGWKYILFGAFAAATIIVSAQAPVPQKSVVTSPTLRSQSQRLPPVQSHQTRQGAGPPGTFTRMPAVDRAAKVRGDRITRLPTIQGSLTVADSRNAISTGAPSQSEHGQVDSSANVPTTSSSESAPEETPASTSALDISSSGDEANLATLVAQSTRANGDRDAECWLSGYFDRIHDSSTRSVAAQPLNYSDDGVPLPAGFLPWWDSPVKRESAVSSVPLSVSVDTLIEQALQFSSYVSVVSLEPEIQQANLVIESAEFDWRSFLDNTYRRGNDPVGNVLTTGNNDTRFIDKTWGLDAGVRRRNQLGGELEVAQRFGTQANNSRFLQPNPQGTSRLELQYTQPLMNGAGRAVNGSRIILADLDSRISQDEAVSLLQDHLVKVAGGYWELYRARAEFFQRVKLLQAAHSTMEVLQGRESVDAVSRQSLRARAAVTSRRSEIVRAQTAIRNAESQLRLLVNSPELVQLGGHELTPEDSPLSNDLGVSMEESLQTALLNRPDISQAIRSVRVSAVRLEVADNLVLPKLDLVATTYVSGLAGQKNFISAFGDQFSEGGLGYSIGIAIERPWGNRAALARQHQRQLEMNRELGKFRLTVEQSLTSAEMAVRETETMYREMISRYQSMLAVDNEVRYLFHRWKEIPGIDDSAAFLLENLLDAQSRLTDEEAALVRAQVGYAMAIVRMKREMGTLLRVMPHQSNGSPGIPSTDRPLDSDFPAANAGDAPIISPVVSEPKTVTPSTTTTQLPSTSAPAAVTPTGGAHASFRRLPALTH